MCHTSWQPFSTPIPNLPFWTRGLQLGLYHSHSETSFFTMFGGCLQRQQKRQRWPRHLCVTKCPCLNTPPKHDWCCHLSQRFRKTLFSHTQTPKTRSLLCIFWHLDLCFSFSVLLRLQHKTSPPITWHPLLLHKVQVQRWSIFCHAISHTHTDPQNTISSVRFSDIFICVFLCFCFCNIKQAHRQHDTRFFRRYKFRSGPLLVNTILHPWKGALDTSCQRTHT